MKAKRQFTLRLDEALLNKLGYIAAAITSQKDKAHLPTHIAVQADRCGLTRDSIVLLEQIRTIDKRRLKDRMGSLDRPSMHQVDEALQISFGLH